jgi:hypothetical protein
MGTRRHRSVNALSRSARLAVTIRCQPSLAQRSAQALPKAEAAPGRRMVFRPVFSFRIRPGETGLPLKNNIFPEKSGIPHGCAYIPANVPSAAINNPTNSLT